MTLPLLSIHSHFSFLNGANKIKDIVIDAKEKGYTSLALTDSGNMCGAIEWYKVCKDNDIQPLFGTSLYLEEHAFCHPRLTIIAKNRNGFSNLSRISSESGFCLSKSGKPTTSLDIIKKNSEDIFAIIPPVNNRFSFTDNSLNDTHILNEYKNIFKNNLFMGVTYQNITEHKRDKTIAFAQQNNIPLVIHPIIYYTNTEDDEVRNVILKIQRGRRPEIEQEIFHSANLSIPFTETLASTMKGVFGDMSNSIEENTKNLAKQCDISFTLGAWNFPNISCKKTDRRAHV